MPDNRWPLSKGLLGVENNSSNRNIAANKNATIGKIKNIVAALNSSTAIAVQSLKPCDPQETVAAAQRTHRMDDWNC